MSTIEAWIADTGERVVATFLAAVAAWVVAPTGIDGTWVERLVAACIPPVLVVISSALPGLTYRGPVWWIDALVRVVRSFTQGAVGALLASVTLLDVSVWQAAGVAGAMAAVAAAKSILAARVAGTLTPASLARTSR